jgi:hypothetical protein
MHTFSIVYPLINYSIIVICRCFLKRRGEWWKLTCSCAKGTSCSTCSGYGEGHDTCVNINGQGIMAFAELQADAEDHDPANANEGE